MTTDRPSPVLQTVALPVVRPVLRSPLVPPDRLPGFATQVVRYLLTEEGNRLVTEEGNPIIL